MAASSFYTLPIIVIFSLKYSYKMATKWRHKKKTYPKVSKYMQKQCAEQI